MGASGHSLRAIQFVMSAPHFAEPLAQQRDWCGHNLHALNKAQAEGAFLHQLRHGSCEGAAPRDTPES